MEYEVHITVSGVIDIDKFKSDCASIGIKPIIIETQNILETDSQVMTSSKHVGQEYIGTVNKISSSLTGLGYNVIREKVEIRPMPEKHCDFKYYESHVRLKLPKGFDMEEVKKICNHLRFHLSKNTLKSDKDFVYQMCTFRDKCLLLYNFTSYIRKFQEELRGKNIEYDKTEIEECVYDTNQRRDFVWMCIDKTGVGQPYEI